MNRTVLLLALVCSGLVVTPDRAFAQSNVAGACSDSLYVALKKRPVDSLSVREYELFRDRDRACLQSPQSAPVPQPYLTGADSTVAPADASATAATAAAAGRELGESQGAAGWFVGGFASGFALGLIGTAVIYAAASNSGAALPSAEQSVLATKGPVYSEAFTRSFREQVKSKRKGAALGGGLLGTATILVIFLSSQSQ